MDWERSRQAEFAKTTFLKNLSQLIYLILASAMLY